MAGRELLVGSILRIWQQATDSATWTWANISTPSIVIAGVGLILAAASAWFAMLGPLKRKPPIKELSFGITRSRPLVQINTLFKLKSLVVTYLGEPVEGLTAVLLTFKNTGDLPLEKTDFESPMRAKLNGVNKVFNVFSMDCFPEHLKPTVSLDGKDIVIDPMLLNAGEHISICAVVEAIESVTAQGFVRISGLGPLPLLRPGNDPNPMKWRNTVTIMQVGATIYFIYMAAASDKHIGGPGWWMAATMTLATLYVVHRERRIARKRRSQRWMGHPKAPELGVD